MNGRTAVSLLALATLVSAAFAGCIEAPSFLTSSGEAEATALENRDLADNAAIAWNPDAVLVGVSAFEASAAHAAASEGKIQADPTLGNGRALLWGYVYQADNETRVFRVDADGRINVENTSMVPASEIPKGEAVTGWTVDSDAAMQAARADATFEAAATAENASVVAALGSEDGAARWALVTVGETFVVAVVDAANGALLHVEEVDVGAYIPAMPGSYGFEAFAPAVHLEGAGSLDGGEPKAEYSFYYGGNGDEGTLELRADKKLPGDGLWWSIVDAEGESVAEGYLGGLVSRSQDKTFDVELQKPGDYTLVLGYASYSPLDLGGVAYEFTLHVGGFDVDVDVDGPGW